MVECPAVKLAGFFMRGKDGGIKVFWLLVSGALLAALAFVVAPALLLPRTPEFFQSIMVARIFWSALVCGLLAIVWAICFRSQLERRRVNLAAVFALITLLAGGLGLIQFAFPWNSN